MERDGGDGKGGSARVKDGTGLGRCRLKMGSEYSHMEGA